MTLNNSWLLVKYRYSQIPESLEKISKVPSGLKWQSYTESKSSIKGQRVVSRTHLRAFMWFIMINIETRDSVLMFLSLISFSRSFESNYMVLKPCLMYLCILGRVLTCRVPFLHFSRIISFNYWSKIISLISSTPWETTSFSLLSLMLINILPRSDATFTIASSMCPYVMNSSTSMQC